MIDFILGESKDKKVKEKRLAFTQKHLNTDLEEFHKLIMDNESEL